MNRLSLRNNRLKEVQDCRRGTDHFRGIYRIYLNLITDNRRMSTCKPVGLVSARISTGYAQESPRSLNHSHSSHLELTPPPRLWKGTRWNGRPFSVGVIRWLKTHEPNGAAGRDERAETTSMRWLHQFLVWVLVWFLSAACLPAYEI